MLQPARNFDDRKALVRGLINALIRNLSIETTDAKAEAIKGAVDKLVSKAKKGSLAASREVMSFLDDEANVEKLLKEIVPGLKERTSGFIKVTKLGRRKGDNAMIVRMEFITKPIKKALAAIEGEKAAVEKEIIKPVVKRIAKVAASKSKRTNK